MPTHALERRVAALERHNRRLGAAQFAHGGGGFALHGPGSKGASVLYHEDGGSPTCFDQAGDVRERISPP